MNWQSERQGRNHTAKNLSGEQRQYYYSIKNYKLLKALRQ